MKYTKEQKQLLGDNIWVRRVMLDMSREELGKAYGCGVTMVCNWERGANPPHSSKIKDLAKILKCSIHELHRPYHIPKLSFTETDKVIEKKEEPVTSDIVSEASKVFIGSYTQSSLEAVKPKVKPVEEKQPVKEVKPEEKGSISDRLNHIYDTLFNTLAELDELKADISKIEKVTTMLKEIQGL